jgi:signal transduction histidine kinase
MLEGSVQQSTTKMFDASGMRMEFNAVRTPGTNLTSSRPENWRERISVIGWLSTAIVHDLRNPLGTVFAGAEMLMELDPVSPNFKRLAANIYRAAGRMRELLADLADASDGGNDRLSFAKFAMSSLRHRRPHCPQRKSRVFRS